MIRIITLCATCMIVLMSFQHNADISHDGKEPYVLVIHGGAGSIRPGALSPEEEQVRTDVLNQALDLGYDILKKDGSAIDAVEASIAVLEDSPYFNAGKGSVLTEAGRCELDASIMNGSDLKAGAVASVTTIKNPIKAARAVMDSSKHVLLVGPGAEAFARQKQLDMVENSYFVTPKENENLKKHQQKLREADTSERGALPQTMDKYGTVGAVALDVNGNLAAGTSTGGMMNKMYGRVGDSPIIGAGTYADNNTCAVSCTGWGEYFIRLSVARDISAMMEYKGMSIQDAGAAALKKVADMSASGGVIAVDKNGNIVMDFNTAGMYRAYRNEKGVNVVEMYGQ